MSSENLVYEIATEYLKVKQLIEKIGFEVIGINPLKDKDVYSIIKKDKSPHPK